VWPTRRDFLAAAATPFVAPPLRPEALGEDVQSLVEAVAREEDDSCEAPEGVGREALRRFALPFQPRAAT
jgi:hypothetical protein